MIAIVGATGNTGRAAYKELRALGENPLCVVRNPDKARDVLGADAKTVVAEITDRPALEQALRGVDRVFVVTGHNPQTGEQQINILEAAKAAGVQYFVKVSGTQAISSPDSPTPVGRGHYAVEQAMMKGGIGWTILRPGLFMQNTFAQAAMIKNDGKMAMPFAADLAIPFIDTRDSGAVGARVVRDAKKYEGQTVEYTGRQSSFGAFAKDFSAVLGKTVTYIAAPYEAAEAALKARGLPDWLVNHQIVMARLVGTGALSKENAEPLKAILGREPISTRQFVQDHKAMFS